MGRTFIFLLTGKEPQDKEIYDPLTNELHWRKSALNLSPLLADLIDHLMAPTANQRPQNTQVILQKLNVIEKALQVPRILWQQTTIQSTNGSKSAPSSSSVATVSVGGVKSLNASSKQTQTSKKLWQVLIGLGLGCFAVVIAAINQPNPKNPVSVSPVENIQVAIPSNSSERERREQLNICKFIAENFKDDLATWLLGSPIKLTELSPTELSNEPIRADSLILLQSDNLVLHTEFQTDADEGIPFRMLDYRVRVYRRFPNKEMRQIVIYLRKTSSELVSENSFKLNNTYHQFEVIRLWEQPTDRFMSIPGLLPFAVLSQTNDPTMVLTQVAKAVEAISDRQLQRNIAAASGILAGLVLNKDVISKILRSEIMRESVIYQQILEEGEAKGKAQGKAQGKAETTRKLALNLLRIGMSLEQIAQVTELPIEQIQLLQEEIQKS